MNLLARLRTPSAIAQSRIQRMSTTVQTDIRAHQCSSSDGDQTGVDDHAVEVDKDACAYLHVEPVVDPNGAFDPWLVLQKSFIFGRALSRGRERSLVFSDTDAGLISCMNGSIPHVPF